MCWLTEGRPGRLHRREWPLQSIGFAPMSLFPALAVPVSDLLGCLAVLVLPSPVGSCPALLLQRVLVEPAAVKSSQPDEVSKVRSSGLFLG